MMQTSRDRLVYTVEEAAGLLGVARSTMYELVRVGEVPSIRVGRRVFITAPAIAALTGVTPPSPAELVARRAAEAQPAELYTIPTDRRALPATRRTSVEPVDVDAQRPLFG
jgi:excisionase family DNA binding protein